AMAVIIVSLPVPITISSGLQEIPQTAAAWSDNASRISVSSCASCSGPALARQLRHPADTSCSQRGHENSSAAAAVGAKQRFSGGGVVSLICRAAQRESVTLLRAGRTRTAGLTT